MLIEFIALIGNSIPNELVVAIINFVNHFQSFS